MDVQPVCRDAHGSTTMGRADNDADCFQGDFSRNSMLPGFGQTIAQRGACLMAARVPSSTLQTPCPSLCLSSREAGSSRPLTGRYLSRRQYAQEILGDLAHHQLEPHIIDAVDVTWASIFDYLGQAAGGHAVVSIFRHDPVT